MGQPFCLVIPANAAASINWISHARLPLYLKSQTCRGQTRGNRERRLVRAINCTRCGALEPKRCAR